jgi:ABC-2 type transport system permease protein
LGRTIVAFVWRAQRRAVIGWGILVSLLIIGNAITFDRNNPTAADKATFAAEIQGGGLTLMFGPPTDAETVAGFTQWRAMMVGALLAIWALMASTQLFRGAEQATTWQILQSGRLTRNQLFRWMSVGLLVCLVPLWLMVFASATIGGAVTDGVIAVGGFAYFATVVVALAAVFLGFGILASQLMSTRQGALGLCLGIWVAAYLLRAVGDLQESFLTWLSPFGWVEKSEPIVDPHYAVSLLLLGAVAILWGVSFLIQRRRDCGHAIIAGRTRRSQRLALLHGLIPAQLRLNLGWMVGGAAVLGFFGCLFGMNVDDADERYAMGSAGFIAMTLSLLGTFAALLMAYQLVKLVKAETGGQSRTVLARPVHRSADLGAHVVTDVVMLVTFLAGAGGGMMLGLATQTTEFTVARMAQALAMWFCAALVTYALGLALFGWLPRAAAGFTGGLILIWFLLEMFGGSMGAPDWLLGLSVWHWIPAVPTEDVDLTFVVLTLGGALLLAIAAFVGYARRDLLQPELEL